MEYTHHCEELAVSRSYLKGEHTTKILEKSVSMNDEEALQSLITCTENWLNPFECNEQLCHLVSGLVTTEEQANLNNAQEKSVELLKIFARERIEMTGTTDFCDPFPKLQLKTVSSVGKLNHVSVEPQVSVLKLTRDVFG